MHKPISLLKISVSFVNKICFENFSAKIYPGNRIAVVGKNGVGKSLSLHHFAPIAQLDRASDYGSEG